MIPSSDQARTRTNGASDPLSAVERGLFFIVGSGRSGTTLLQVMLATHPEITLPNETGFYSLIRRKNLRRLGELTTPEAFAAGFDAALSHWRFREFGVEPERVQQLCQHRSPSWETLFLAILTAVAEKRGASRIGEKSPRHIDYLGLLARRFPDARFIHMIRDPRAVASSYHRTFGIRSIGAKCQLWKRAIEQHHRFAVALGDRYMTVRYEDLVGEPERQLRAVCDFLECQFSPAMLDYHSRDHLGFAPQQMHHMQNTLKPVFTSSLDSWKQELSMDQIALVEHALGDQMEQFGYHLLGARTRMPALKYCVHLTMDKGGRLLDRLRNLAGLEVRRRRKR